MPAEAVVRAFRRDDIPVLAAVGLRAWDVGIGPHIPDAVRTDFLRLNPFLPWLETVKADILVAIVGDVVAGFSARETPASLDDLWVDPPFHGKGVAQRLLERTMEGASRDGVRVLDLQVLAANRRAIAFYQRNGFKTVWREMRLSSHLGIELDKMGMERAI